MTIKPLILPVLLASAIVSTVAQSAATEYAMPKEPRLVVYQYDPNLSYTILSAPGMVTNITLGSDERLVALALGDTVQWVPAKTENHVFLKPMAEGLSTSGTLLTDKRAYQLFLKSVRPEDKWHQRVSWNYPDILLFERRKAAEVQQVIEKAKKRSEDAVVSGGANVESLNFDYAVNGRAAFRPMAVFDDGKFTWLRMPKVQELPALFVLATDGKEGELVNYQVKGDYFVVNRTFSGAVMKLGKDSVQISNNKSPAARSKSSWSLFE